jgi:predicted peroxiredoxin
VIEEGEEETIKMGDFPTLKEVMEETIKQGIPLFVC